MNGKLGKAAARGAVPAPAILAAAVFAALAAVSPAFGEGYSLEVQPQAFIPYRAGSELFRLGGGAAFRAGADFRAPLYGRFSVTYTYLPTIGGSGLSLATAELGGGLRLEASDRLSFRLGASLGAFAGIYDDLTGYNPMAALESDFRFKFNEGFGLGLGAAYAYHVGSLLLSPALEERSFAEGVRVFLGASFVPGAEVSKTRNPRLEIGPPRFEAIFPVFYQYYNGAPVGTVSVTNRERRTVRNVSVSFLVPQFMDEPKLGARIPKLDPGETAEVPILALFKDSILTVTEGTTVSGRIIVDYEEGSDVLSVSRSESVRILNRNNLTWDDDRKAAAFVTANDPTVLRFARNISAAVRGEGAAAVNERLRIAMALFQAMNLYGLEYSIDPDSSYIELSKSDSALDMVQFPRQTLDFRSGDCDDLSVLYSALLESVGIRTAFITVPGHIFLAFALDLDEAEARRTFSRPEEFIFLDKETWVPVEATLIKRNFLDAWAAGAKQWRENQAGRTAAFHPVRDAWKTYPPTGFSSDALAIAVPQTTEVVPVYGALLRTFIDREIAPQVADLRARIEASRGNQRLINRLGTLYARYGLYEEAEKEFQAATRFPDYLPALVNLGNIALIRSKLRDASEYYERARRIRQDDPLVLVGLARVHFELAEYAPATQRYREAELIDPAAVTKFAYIVGENRELGRASAAQTREAVQWKEE